MEGDPIVPPFVPCCFISIHALRVEGDPQGARLPNCTVHISIHALRVEGDLYGGAQIVAENRISIHALRVEGDYSAY